MIKLFKYFCLKAIWESRYICIYWQFHETLEWNLWIKCKIGEYYSPFIIFTFIQIILNLIEGRIFKYTGKENKDYFLIKDYKYF